MSVLSLLQERGLPLSIVTGRSLSWGHFFLTHFPQIDSVICEGGGVILFKDLNGRMVEENLVLEEDFILLEQVACELVNSFDCPLSLDSFGRRTDRAIDLYNFKSNEGLKNRIEDFLREKSLHFSSSNVHLNFWKGEVSKSRAMKYLLRKKHPNYQLNDCLFFGDAPNDESVFECFPKSVGVSNIQSHLHYMRYHPKVILQGKENEGVKGVLNYLLGEEKAT